MAWLFPQFNKDTTSFNYWRAEYADGFVRNTFWLGLGAKDTGWDDNDNPPDSTVGTLPIEVLGYRKVQYKTLVVPDSDGSLQWRNLQFRPIDSADRLQKTLGVYPRWAFLRTTITTSELPTSKYFRQIFLYTDLVPARGYTAYDYLTPSQVEDVGNLIWIENIPQMYRLDNQIEEIGLIFEF